MSWIKKKTLSILIVTISSLVGALCVEIGLRVLNINNDWIVTEDANILRDIEFSYDISNLYPSDIKVADYVRNEFGSRRNDFGIEIRLPAKIPMMIASITGEIGDLSKLNNSSPIISLRRKLR